jgi:hypothetical protein
MRGCSKHGERGSEGYLRDLNRAAFIAGNGLTALSMMDTERGHAMAAQGRKHNWAALLLHPGAESGIGPEKMPMNGGGSDY